jgi:hypothetical protein
VTVPVGWKAVPEVKLAESLDVPPTVIVADEVVVVIAGMAFATVTGSQEPVAALLLASPE